VNSADRQRYSRQILFPGIGERGQEALLSSHAVIAGCGALGSFQLAALVRAGVGRITVIDRDYVEPSNLHRQWLFDEADAADSVPKAAAAVRHAALLSSSVELRGIVADLTASNVAEFFESADVILDGTDNFDTRYLVNDYAILHGVPWIYGAAVGSYGLAMPVIPDRSACLRCVYPDPPAGPQPTCETAGVVNVVISAVASFQVADALKILSGQISAVRPSITTVDVWNGGVRQIETPPRDPECPACGRREFPFLDDSRRQPVSLCGRNAVQVHERQRSIDLDELGARLRPLGEVRSNEYALRFLTDPYELTVFPDGRAIVKGTSDPAVARTLYARFVGA
jgi:adenylyltransferase/sulfurtransferase